MDQLFVTVAPMSLAATVSPMMLSEQLLVLGGGRRPGAAYIAGAATVLAALTAMILTVGRSLALPHAPHLSARVDIVLGVGLMVLAVTVWRRRPRHHADHRIRSINSRDAYGFGLVSMTTNATTLALVIAATKDISAANVGIMGTAAALAMVLLGASAPTWVPLLAVVASPQAAPRVLGEVSTFAKRNGRRILTAVMLAVGVFLLARGWWHFR